MLHLLHAQIVVVSMFQHLLIVNCRVSNSSTSIHLSIPVTSDHQALEIHMVKVTEVSCVDAKGVMEIESVSSSNLLPSSTAADSVCFPSKGKLLFIGDSLTAAYGVDGAEPCSFTAGTEDVTHGYSFLVASAVGAEVHSIAWSGKGVVHNNGDSVAVSASPMPVYYNRTFGSIENSLDNYWQPASYTPNVISIMLGQNDYSTQPNPTDVQFTSALVAFINQIKVDYPLTEVLVICSPSPVVPQQCPNILSAATTTNVHYFTMSSNVYEGGKGCDGHPNQLTQQNMAASVTSTIADLMTMSMKKGMQRKRVDA